MKKVILIVVVLLLVLTACTPATTTEETEAAATEETKEAGDFVIGLCIQNNDVFIANMKDAAEAKANELGVELLVLNGQQNIEKQMNDVESFLAKEVDAIILNAIDLDSLNNSVDKAKDAGIPLVEVNTFTNNDRYDVFVGSPEEDAGRIQGEFIKKNVGETGKLCILYGIMGESAQIGRYDGLKESLLDTTDWEVLADKTGNWDRAKAMDITEDWLQTFTEIDVIVAQNDEMAMGAMQAVEKSGRDIKVLGIDGNEDAVKAVKEGRLAMTVFQDGRGQGAKSVEVALGILMGEIYDKNVSIPFLEVNMDNADDFLN